MPPLEPNWLVLLAPGADADEVSPAWVDASPDLLALDSITRGSPGELDRNNPGAAVFTLDNWSGDWDNENPDSPHAGQLTAMTQVLIYAEHDGDLYPRFRGFLDDIQLDYPGEGVATATFSATDGFKPLAQSDLASSAYAQEVLADGPVAWWRLGEPDGSATAFDSAGTAHAEYQNSPDLGNAGIVSRDPGSSASFTHSSAERAEYPGLLITGLPYTVEAVVYLASHTDEGRYIFSQWWGPQAYIDFWFSNNSPPGDLGKLFYTADSSLAAGTQQTVGTNAATPTGTLHIALVVTGTAATDVLVYVNGAAVATTVGAAGAAMTIPTTAGTAAFSMGNITSREELLGLFGLGDNNFLQDVAVYDYNLGATRIAAHAEALTTPWNNDTPAERAHRVADAIGWPDAMRDFDTGASTLQSADIAGQSALDHLQKVAESEFGALFVSRDGTLTLRARGELVNRHPIAVFGPDDDEAGYRTITFDNSDTLIRNPVTISRSEGVAQTAEDSALRRRFYRHQFTLDGLLHDDDSLSRDAADFLLSEYKEPRRRITGLTFGPAEEDRISDWYPLLLEADLGEVYTVRFQPPNVADPFEQRCVLEGITESWSPAAGHAVTWQLSPALAGTFWELDSLDGDGLDYDRLFF